jgi:hypothetical protein
VHTKHSKEKGNLKHHVLELFGCSDADAHFGLHYRASAHAATAHLHPEQVVEQRCNRKESFSARTQT